MEYKLASSTWGLEERESILRVLDSERTTMGARVQEFERDFAEYVGSKYAIMVNSGSSANLLAIAALSHKKVNRLLPGQEIIVPAVSWATTYYPLNQYGLTCRFVDVDADSLCMDIQAVANSINENTAAIFAVNLLGQPSNLVELHNLAKSHGIYLIEDNCESFGATISNKQCGTWGVLGTFSTFFSHHISTMEGGLIVTDDDELRDIVVSLRAHGWTRELNEENHVFPKVGKDWDDRFRFVLPGYNVRPLEIEGAVGIEQLKKFPQFLSSRRTNHANFQETFGRFEDIRLQSGPGATSSFGFSILLEGKLRGRRESLLKAFEFAGIESRPIVSGNFARQPVLSKLKAIIPEEMPVADHIHENGLFLGNHHFDLTEEIHYAEQVFEKWREEN